VSQVAILGIFNSYGSRIGGHLDTDPAHFVGAQAFRLGPRKNMSVVTLPNRCSTTVGLMGEREQERVRQMKADRDYVARAAHWRNYEAAQDQYAGWRNAERAYELGSLLSYMAIHWFDLPDPMRKTVLHVARGVLGERHDGNRGQSRRSRR